MYCRVSVCFTLLVLLFRIFGVMIRTENVLRLACEAICDKKFCRHFMALKIFVIVDCLLAACSSMSVFLMFMISKDYIRWRDLKKQTPRLLQETTISTNSEPRTPKHEWQILINAVNLSLFFVRVYCGMATWIFGFMLL